jgi:hypothetical protein
MKRILIILAIIPFMAFAQSQTIESTKPPLIESITTDTVQGEFYQIVFSYDQRNRVVTITNKVVTITTDPNKKKKQDEQITRQQTFEYKGTELAPFSRKIESYQFDYYKDKLNSAKWYLASNAQQYFLYKNGQRVGDSTLLLERREDSEKWTGKPKKRIGFLKQTGNIIYHEMDLKKPGNDPLDDSRNTYADKFKLTYQSNISYDSSEHLYANHGGGSSYYTFSKYDSMLNPLKQLNIAQTLVNEKICLYDGNDFQNHNQFWEIFRGGHYGNVDFSWYYINQNNPVSYFTTVNDQSSPFKTTFTLKYTYNQFKQPVYAKAQEKLVFNKEDRFYENHNASITFRYKK